MTYIYKVTSTTYSNIIDSPPAPDVTGVRGTDPGDSTGKKALRLAVDEKIKRAELILHAHDSILEDLRERAEYDQDAEMTLLVFEALEKYGAGCNADRIAMEINSSKSAIYRYRGKIIEMVMARYGSILYGESA